MIKWFFIYKWLELKEFIQEHWIPVSAIGIAIVSSIVWHAILTAAQINQSTFQIACLSVLLGVITMMVMAFCLAMVSWLKRVVKDNIEKARTAISYDVSELECCNCADGKIKLLPPLRSTQYPRFQCLDCGFVSDVRNADRRKDGNNKR